jgi:hypothetical protein
LLTEVLKMAAGGLVVALIPYFEDLIHKLSTNEDLRKMGNGINYLL